MNDQARAEHLITLADKARRPETWSTPESRDEYRDWITFQRAAIAEAVWVARQLLEALNRIEQLEKHTKRVQIEDINWLGEDADQHRYWFAAGYNDAMDRIDDVLRLNPKEADKCLDDV